MRKFYIFFRRTVLVENNDVEGSLLLLNRILGREGILEDARRNLRYEKPTVARRRINYEICKDIVNEDMTRKVNFLLRKNRQEPYPGCK